MDEHSDSLTRARHACAAQDWATAALHFDAVAADRLTADDLAAYTDAVLWLGRIEDNLRLSAAACDAFLADSRPVEAARAAMVLGIFHLARGDEPQGMGWIGRAGHLLEGIPESPVHGYLLHITEVEASLLAGQPAAALDAARRMQDLGRRLDQPDLMALGLNGEGRALIRSGHVVDGLKLLDEAMVTVLGGAAAAPGGRPRGRRDVGARGLGGGRPRPLAPGPTVCCGSRDVACRERLPITLTGDW